MGICLVRLEIGGGESPRTAVVVAVVCGAPVRRRASFVARGKWCMQALHVSTPTLKCMKDMVYVQKLGEWKCTRAWRGVMLI